MRAVLDAHGNHVIQDGPVRVEGSDAERLLTEMVELEREGHTEQTRYFMDECERIYAATIRRSR
jgi:hypothetical protein